MTVRQRLGRVPLGGKLFAAFALVAVVAPVLAAGIGQRLLVAATVAQTHRQLERTAAGIAVDLGRSDVLNQAEGAAAGSAVRVRLRTLAAVAADAAQATVAVVDTRGDLEVAAYRGISRQAVNTPEAQALIARVLAGRALPSGVMHDQGTAFLVAGQRVEVGGRTVGAVLALTLWKEARASGRFAAAVLWRALFVDVLLSLLLGAFLAGGITRPVRAMAAAAEAIARGEFRQRVPPGPNDEVGVLAESFNRMAERLDRLLRARRELLAAISHELRTPLTSVSGFVSALREGLVPPGDEERVLGIIQDDLGRLRRLIDDLFALSKLEAGQARLQLQDVAVADLLEEAAERGRVLAGPGQRMEVDAAPSAGVVRADPDRLAQVLANLVANAVRHSPADGVIRLRARGDDATVHVEIADQGPGIPPEDREHVFERFWTGDPSRARPGGGTGLGLSIAREIVRAHDGRMGVEGGPGEGARLWFSLPRRGPRLSSEAADISPGPGS